MAQRTRDFVQALSTRWLTLMSGPASVPLAILAFVVSNEIARILLGATAFCCAWGAAYVVWKAERDKRMQAEKELADLRSISSDIELALDEQFAYEAGQINSEQNQ